MKTRHFAIHSPGPRLLQALTLLLALSQTASAAGELSIYDVQPVAVFRMVITESAAPLVSQGDLMTEDVFQKQLADWQKAGSAKVALDSGFLAPLSDDEKAPWHQPEQGAGGNLRNAFLNARLATTNGALPGTKIAQQPDIQPRRAGPSLIVHGRKEGNDALKLGVRAAVWEIESLSLAEAIQQTTGSGPNTKMQPMCSTATEYHCTCPLGSCVALCVRSKVGAEKHLTLFLLPISQRPALMADASQPVVYGKGTAQVVKGRVPVAAFWSVMRSIRPDIAPDKPNEAQLLEMAWSDEKFHTFQKVMEQAGGAWGNPSPINVGLDSPPPPSTDGTHVALTFAEAPASSVLEVAGSCRVSYLGATPNNINTVGVTIGKRITAEALQKRWNLVVTTTANEVQIAAFCPQLEEAKRAGR